ncbi:UBP1-associated protein 2A-like [Lycium ferocissimum]|uniref:UBP1-associated protein 2A-like n=1 Tax=Lycium ferocissimum TaxID=112874 RepID=UPI0028156076|nr:UBP1-associated protein 2A-like [Lycium ferocissimum]
MAAKNNIKKRKLIKNTDSIATPSKIKKQQKTPKPNNPTRPEPTSDSDSDSDPLPVKIQKLLEPYTKDQLITLAVNTALSHPSFYNLIQSTADKDITHRKIFVYGLARETTRQTLLTVFEEFGAVEECNVVIDHVTGKAKGYAFIVFKTRKEAEKALKEPRKTVNNRVVSCKLASMKKEESIVSGDNNNEFGNRKIYVSNVNKDVDSEKLRMFFAKFGEIEVGPMGFDPTTGKSKGYALFVYKRVEEAKKCLEEPCKLFEGRQLYCKKAAEGKIGGGAASITTEIIQQPALLAMQPPGQGLYGMGMVGQNPNVAMMNPFYGGVLANPYAGYVNPFLGVGGFGQQMGGGMGIAGYGGLLDSLGGAVSGLGAYGGGVGSSTGGSTGGVGPGLLQAYPNKQVGLHSTAKLPGSSGYSSHL